MTGWLNGIEDAISELGAEVERLRTPKDEVATDDGN